MSRQPSFLLRLPTSAAVVWAMAWTTPPLAEDRGAAIYLEHCQRCHGDRGAGTPEHPDPLVGDLSVSQLAACIDETMPENDPSLVTGELARAVAEYVHAEFYSAVARDRHRPARVDLARLTVRQQRNTLADLVGSFREPPPPLDGTRGLKGEYFRTREFNREQGLVFERTDPKVDFDFAMAAPGPEGFEPTRFAIRWTGSIVPVESGVHEFVVRSPQAVRLSVNTDDDEPPLIDGYVSSGDDHEHRASLFLLGGRAYPVRLEFSKAVQGVDLKDHEKPTAAAVRLLWKPPFGALEPVPERVLVPQVRPRVFVSATPFPPDDKSTGFERGTAVSPEWFAATTTAAIETADHVLDRIERLAHVTPDAADRGEKLRQFAATFAERAFRRPLDEAGRALFVDRPFADAPDPDTGLRRSLLAILGSPRFLFRETGTDPFATAARLSFGLWDSIPDAPLRDAAARGDLTTTEQVRGQAERMVTDPRTRAKLREFLLAWLRVDLGPELRKDTTLHPDFTPEVAADLRTSLHLFLDAAVWEHGDFRRLFTDDELPLNGRLAAFYGVPLPADAPFTRVRLDAEQRGGILTHPYLMAALSYPATTSPIHRGVFLARSVLGNVLRPPPDAVAPAPPEQHPDLTTRERVAMQTSAVACQTCHTMINPLGFAVEEFDAVGRRRMSERAGAAEKPIDASGGYRPRTGEPVSFRGGRELAAYVASSPDAHEAFVQAVFHALVKQSLRAWGPDAADSLRRSFEASGFDVRRLLVDIMVLSSFPPSVGVASVTPAESLP